MPIALLLLCITLLMGSVGLLVYWSVVGWHIARTVRNLPTLRDGLNLPEALALASSSAQPSPPLPPLVCMVIPAHNERDVIVDLAQSLAAQDYPNLRVVFALDRCTDDTEALLHQTIGQDARFEIVLNDHCPEGWAGKVNAIHRGVTGSNAAATAEYLIFADADTRLDPGCVRAAVALARSRSLGFLSIMSTLTTQQWFERVVQPVAGIELMRQYPLERASASTNRRAFANGQFMLFSRSAYNAVGGHPAVRDEILEDIALSRLCQKHAITANVLLSAGMLRCRMYASWSEFTRGWKRIYTESANCKVSRLRTQAFRVRLLGCLLPLMAIGALMAGLSIHLSIGPGDPLAIATAITGGLALASMLTVLAWSYRLGGTPIRAVWAYPVGAWLVGKILRSAASDLVRGVPTRWAGRTYARPAR
ncbi:MAG: glycosyltransferase family 2 protein [Phycisphaerales bacterium]|nr:glycosyltransferase family 2 protein [Phycisphaerales bacterium]